MIRMYVLPPTIFTQFFSFFPLLHFLFGNVRIHVSSEESKSRVEHKKCHISEMGEKKRKVILVGSGKICAILHVHYMHGGQRAFPKKKN